MIKEFSESPKFSLSFVTPLSPRTSLYRGITAAIPGWSSGRRPSSSFLSSILSLQIYPSSCHSLPAGALLTASPLPTLGTWPPSQIPLVFPYCPSQPFIIGHLHSFVTHYQPAEQLSTWHWAAKQLSTWDLKTITLGWDPELLSNRDPTATIFGWDSGIPQLPHLARIQSRQ